MRTITENQKERIYHNLSISTRFDLIELLETLTRLPAYIYENHKDDIRIILHWIKKSIELLYKSCYNFKDERMYTTNMFLPLIEEWIQKLEIQYIPEIIKLQKDLGTKKEEIIPLVSIFNKKNNAFKVCLELLDDLELTIDGKPNPDNKKGRVGKLIGLISAIKDTPGMLILDKPKQLQLLKYFNSYLHTTYKTFSKRSEDYRASLDISKRYIKSNFKK